uniref:Uncharacterized protein n=1 Tax=Siphoviridae sp. ctqPo10 TaxID=2827948 RepID=A0A8S5SUR6_9CAUD|nr:MAG TPA: hypothetical protein [Siphoviridae sp. ctqPo10]
MNMRLSEIKISADFESSIPNTYKYNKCENYYNKTGNQDRYIVVDEKNVLVDGYIMYLVLKNHDVEYGNVKRLTLRKHTYTDKQRKQYGRLISPKHVVTYKEKPTAYVYGKHPNSKDNKEYVWRLPQAWGYMSLMLQKGDVIYCGTRFGVAPVVVTKVELKSNFDTSLCIKKVCSQKIYRNGELLKYDSKDGSTNV